MPDVELTIDLTTMTVGQKRAISRMLHAHRALTETTQVALLGPVTEAAFDAIAALIEDATRHAVECLAR